MQTRRETSHEIPPWASQSMPHDRSRASRVPLKQSKCAHRAACESLVIYEGLVAEQPGVLETAFSAGVRQQAPGSDEGAPSCCS